MFPHLHVRVAAVLSLLLIATSLSCTRGKVTDGDTGDSLGGVSIDFDEWPPPSASNSDHSDWAWPQSASYTADYQTLSGAKSTYQNLGGSGYSGDPPYNYGFHYDTASCIPSVENDTVTVDTWYRIEFIGPPQLGTAQSQYNTRILYAYHDGYDEDCTLPTFDSQCNYQDLESYTDHCFTLPEVKMWHGTDTRDEQPDLMADPRNLDASQIQCAVMNPSIPGSESSLNPTQHASTVIGIRTDTGIANVGRGPLYIEKSSPGSYCYGNVPCPDGYSCSSGFCSPNSCSSDSDCPSGLTCRSGSCKPQTCTSDADCSDGHCSFSGSCDPFYDTQDPYEGGSCACSSSDPLSDCQCPGDLTCIESNGSRTCEYRSCQSDSDCTRSGFDCSPDGLCARPSQTNKSCATDDECKSHSCTIDTSSGICPPPTYQKVQTVDQNQDPSPTYTKHQTSTDFTYHAPHQHTHFDEFVSLRMVKSQSSCERHPDDRSSSQSQDCRIGESQKVSFCLMDTRTFDEDIAANADESPLWQSNSQGDPCYAVQGISSGYKDVYTANLPGQVVYLGDTSDVQNNHAGNDYLLEAEVDPENALIEDTRINNWGQTGVSLPSWSSSNYCDPNAANEREVFDCRDFPFTNQTEGMSYSDANAVCRGYAKFYCNDHSPSPSWCSKYGY